MLAVLAALTLSQTSTTSFPYSKGVAIQGIAADGGNVQAYGIICGTNTSCSGSQFGWVTLTSSGGSDGGGSGAPTNASYITEVAESGLSAEFAMASLSTGLVKNTTTTGVPSIYAGTSCTNQFPRSLNASGAATCASVALASDVSGTLPQGNGGTGAGTLTCSSGQCLTSNGSAYSCTSTITANDVACASTCVSDAEISAVSGSKVSGAVATATALASDPSDCAANRYATSIDTGGNLTCAQVSLSAGVTGTTPIANGGTGVSSLACATGQALWADGGTVACTSVITASDVACSSCVSLSSEVTGTLPVANGGTGAAPGADDQVLVSDSTSAATWRSVTNCTDSSGSHLNYTASTNTFSCGTTQLHDVGGSSPQIQYNNSGAFGGVADYESDGTHPQHVAVTAHPSAPSTDRLSLYGFTHASGQDQTLWQIDSFMALPVPAGLYWGSGVFAAVNTTATWHAECHLWGIWGASGTANSMNIGSGTSVTNTGANFNQIAWANTNWKTRQRLGGSSNAGTNSTSAGIRLPTFTSWRGNVAGAGGFVLWQRAYVASAVVSQRSFFGLAATTSALSAAADPSATTNAVYFGCDQAQTTLRVMSNDNSGTATQAKDLGSNFPCTTNGAGYDFWLAAKPNDTSIYWAIERLDSAQTDQGTISSDLPQNTVQLAPQAWINNGADGGNTTARIDWGGLCMLNNL